MGLFGFGKSGVIPNGYDNTLPDNAAYGSKVINGQLTSVYTLRGMFPSQAAAPYYSGNGSKPATLAGFPAITSGLQQSAAVGIGGGGGLAAAAGDSPWDMRVSPTGWAIAFLVVGMLGLRHIHWSPK